MARILGIGNATLDIILTVDAYPLENDEIRCTGRALRRGGNTANSLVVLSQLGHACSWAGVLADTAEGTLLRDDLCSRGIDTGPARVAATGSVPVSYVLVSRRTGSRTIVHHRELDEYSFADFRLLDLPRFDWLHFEGRNVAALRCMLQWAGERCPRIPRSLEVEKPRPGIEELFGLADVLLFSRVYANSRGYQDPAGLLESIHRRVPAADLFCTLGAEGAVCLDRNGVFTRQGAVEPPRVVDTLGAGDTFNAGVIDGCLARQEAAAVLRRACTLAGEKCGRSGFDGVR